MFEVSKNASFQNESFCIKNFFDRGYNLIYLQVLQFLQFVIKNASCFSLAIFGHQEKQLVFLITICKNCNTCK